MADKKEPTTEEKKEDSMSSSEVKDQAEERINPPKPEATEEKKDGDSSEDKKTEPKVDLNTTFRVGDTVKVNYKIIEGGKERIQPFEGIVISKKGKGVSKTFTVRRIGAKNIGVERIFPVYSPKISSINVVKLGVARRAKLYYLRQQRSKKDAKIKEKVEA